MQEATKPHLQHRRAEEKTHGKKTPPEPKGLLTIFTGHGKGQSTAAFGMAWHAIAQNIKVGVVQFTGGSKHNAQCRTLSKHRLCDFQTYCSECQWNKEHYDHDKVQVVTAWLAVRAMMADQRYGMIICDEINPLIRDQYLNSDTLEHQITTRRPELHMVFTGRNAPLELLAFADQATEMQEIRPPFSLQILAPQAGGEAAPH